MDQSLELITSGTGFAVSLVATPVGGGIAEKAVRRVLEYTVRRFTHVYESGEVTLNEVLGRSVPDERYKGVGDFWSRVVEDQLGADALIEISGFLSPYGPLMPGHPMSRPGYTVEGWEAIGDLGTEDTEEYDGRDGFIYGDRVIRLSSPRNQQYYAGLYDPYYGISNVTIPIYINETIVESRKHELKELWEHPMTAGKLVKIKGYLREVQSYYAQFDGQLPSKYCTLPSFGLEVSEIESAVPPAGVTHMAITTSWTRHEEERMVTHYFNVQDRGQFVKAEELLEHSRESHSRSLLFNYDDLATISTEWRHRLPVYNEMLRPWLEGQSL